jgi:hypothetical protein
MDYSNGKIYKLNSSNLDKCYIGSTTTELAKRKHQHLLSYRQFLKNSKVDSRTTSHKVFEAGGEITIILIEEFPCANKMELERREREHIEKNECVNRQLPAPTLEEAKQAIKDYYQEHREEICQRVKEYREANPEIIKERKKAYAEANKEKIAEKAKAWREENKEVISQKAKERYEANKDKINARVVCPTCNEEMSKSSLLRHNKRKH